MEKLFQIIHISPVTATIEMCNDQPFYSEQAFDVYLDDQLVISQEKKNVFTIFDLTPDTTYCIRIGDQSENITTLAVNQIINAGEHGLVGDGQTDNTEAIQALFDNCDHDLIVFEEGTYWTKPLTIRSNTFVYLKEGAMLLASPDRDDYPIIEAYGEKDGEEVVNASWEGTPGNCFQSLINIVDSHDIMVVGQGTIDGNANNGDWWLGNVKIMKKAWRGNNVFVNRCQNIDFIGCMVKNPPSWNIHPFYSDHLHFYDLSIQAFVPSPNTDGFNPESCDDVHLVGCEFECGDDCIAIKSGKAIMAQKFYRPCTNINIRNCLMNEGHGAIVFGSESSCGIYGVTVSKCIFDNTDRGLRIKTKRGRGNKANVEDVTFDNILMRGVKNGLTVNMYYYLMNNDPNDPAFDLNPLPKDETTPHLGKFYFKNMKCLDTKVSAGYFYGLPESPIGEIKLENITVTYDKSFEGYEEPAMIKDCELLNNGGYYFYNVESVDVENVTIEGQKGEKYNLKNVGKSNI